MMHPVIFRESDIRGVYEKDFDLSFAEDLGRSFFTYIKNTAKKESPTITIGMDARLSSPNIVNALTKGFTSSGGNVIQLGLITTPISYFSTFTMPQVDGAIMVTGSHNPPDYNGFKVSVGKRTINGPEIQELKNILEKKDFSTGAGKASTYDIFPEYVERYKKEFGDLSGVPVVLDCGNGAAGSIARRLYEALNVDVQIIFEKPDGTFPNHHPDPTVEENNDDLKKQVLKHKAALGIGFDGDADRIGMITNTARFLLGDEIMTVFAKDILSKQPGAKIIGDVKCSDRMYQMISKYGGNAIMWKTGHSLIKEKVKSEKAPFGGELSCHIFFADRNYGYDDSLYAGLRMIEILKTNKTTIEGLLEDYPEAFSTPEIRIDTTEEKKTLIVQKMREHYLNKKDISLSEIDGVRASYKNGWALVRSSNTQPVVSMRFEANTKQALEEIQSEAMKIVNAFL
ncbi:MAG: phosphomannomutase/phosphoglucomutase [Bdellovibrionales bacterium]|nr:phosphomannomutase/phosphoglucomutase [Bdellovibrionales bacterium]